MTTQDKIKKIFSREMIWKWMLALVLTLNSFFFYSLMKMEIYYVFLSLCTSLFLILFFFGFKNRWIPFGIHIAISILMFADVTFNAYFNGYLSLNMMGSAQYVGDVLDIISQIIRPNFFFLFLWIPVAAVFIRMDRCVAVRARPDSSDFSNASKAPNSSNASNASNSSNASNAKDMPEAIDGKDSLKAESVNTAMLCLKQRAVSFCRKGWSREVLLVLLLALLVFNPAKAIFLQSAGNLEFVSYHIKDVLHVVFGVEEESFEAQAEADYRPIESDPLFGAAEGKNLVVIQVEALQNFVIGEVYNGREITPVLNSLVKDSSLYFDHYYMQIGAGNTSDAEFATNNSLYGTNKSYTYEIYKDNAFRGLPWLLMDRGYSTVAMHGFEGEFWSRESMYPAQGFQTFVDDEGFKEEGTASAWGISDAEFFKQAVAYLQGEQDPFYGFLITLTSHTPFELPEELLKHSNVEIMAKHEGSRFGNYIQSISYADYALGVFLQEMKDAGLYENTVIAIYGDHFGLSISDDRNDEFMSEFLGKPYRFDSMANVPLIIHIPGTKREVGLPKTVSTAGGHLDFMPTMAYLMGFQSLDTLYMGNNLLDTTNGLVIQDRYAPPGSFLTNTVAYMGIGDGVFETGKAWNIETGEVVPKDSGMKKLWQKAIGLLNFSANDLNSDRIRDLYYADGKADRVEMSMPRVARPKPVQTSEPKESMPEESTGSAVVTDGGMEPESPDSSGEGSLLPENPSETEPGGAEQIPGQGTGQDGAKEPQPDVEPGGYAETSQEPGQNGQ